MKKGDKINQYEIAFIPLKSKIENNIIVYEDVELLYISQKNQKEQN